MLALSTPPIRAVNCAARLSVLLCSVALAGCAIPGRIDLTATPVSDVAQRVQALLPLDALLLGEQHDAPDHQRIHREVIEALAARGALAGVVLEMAMQGNSTASLVRPVSTSSGNVSADVSAGVNAGAGAIGAVSDAVSDVVSEVVRAKATGGENAGVHASEDAVRATLKWDERAWPWGPYAPAIMAAVRAGVPVMGSNMARAQMGSAMQQPDLDQRLNGPALKAQQQLIRLGHCNLLPESQISPMTRIQIARDVAMANAIVQAHAEAALASPMQPVETLNTGSAGSMGRTGNTGNASTTDKTDIPAKAAKTVVLLAGSGHVDRTLGVPQHLPPGLKIKSVLLVAGSASDAAGRAGDFDAVWAAAPVPAKDYCAGLKARLPG